MRSEIVSGNLKDEVGAFHGLSASPGMEPLHPYPVFSFHGDAFMLISAHVQPLAALTGGILGFWYQGSSTSSWRYI
jgi:hypothetical protein